MKRVYIALIALTFLLYHCTNFKKNDKTDRIESDCELENDVINQTIPLVLDSLSNQISLNFKNTDSIRFIYYADSLFGQRYDFQEIQKIFLYESMLLDTIHLKNCRIKLLVKNRKLEGDRELSPISSIEEITKNENDKFVLLDFTRVNFDKEKSIAFFNVDLSCSLNAGLEYAVSARKENDKWIVRRIIESAIR